MSLAINTTTPEGIVLAADSRQSYRNRKGIARIGSDNASKLFMLNKRSGVAVTGLAFLPEDGVFKNISKFIEQFKNENDIENSDIKILAEKMNTLFNEKYNWQEQIINLKNSFKKDLPKQGCKLLETVEPQPGIIEARFKDPNGNLQKTVAGIDKVCLLIAGYNQDGTHEVYTCYIPGDISKKRDSKEKDMEYGASWIGQMDVVGRIILGYDSRIRNVRFVGDAIQKLSAEEINKQLRSLEYSIQWGTMTLQDAVDFCTLMIQTTSAIQRFSDGITADPGDMPGVGGPVDVAVITPDKGFVWVNKKEIEIKI